MARFVMFYACARNPAGRNYHLHVGFLEKAFALGGHELVHYGPVSEGVKDGPLPYKNKRPLDDALRQLKADGFVHLGAKSAGFSGEAVTLDIPKIVYAGEFHRHTNDDLARFDAVVLRARNQVTEFETMGASRRVKGYKWVPFSFDPDAVKQAPDVTERERAVSFVGATFRSHYPARTGALDALQKAGLLWDGCLPLGYEKIRDLREYYTITKRCMFGLTCCSKRRYNVAKHVEIPACGAVLLTDGTAPGLECMIPSDLYIKYTPGTVVETVQNVLNDPGSLADAQAMAERAKNYVHEHDTDAIRGREMLDWLRDAIGLEDAL